jgi:DNA-binding XRE family transcriptional regulator
MSYALAMSGEIRAWLTGLAETDSPPAMAVGAALVALAVEGASLGPPVVVPPRGVASSDPREALDYLSRDQLERMQAVRRAASDAAALTSRLQAQLAEVESQPGADANSQAAELRQSLTEARLNEQRMLERAQRMQADTDDLRTRKEVLMARYAAALAHLDIAETLVDVGVVDDDNNDGDSRPGGQSVAEAAAKVRDITAEIERELRRETRSESLMELRPGGAGGSNVGVIFAIEPPGTALLISVVDAGGASRPLLTEAVRVSADVLWQVRNGRDPQASEWVFEDAQSFLGEFFPGTADEVRAGAAALVASTRVGTLAEHRTRLGLTQAQVAARMGVGYQHVLTIERAGPGETDLRTLASYVESLGGQLEVTADFRGERVPLRW